MKRKVKAWLITFNGKPWSYFRHEENSLIKNVYAVYKDKKDIEHQNVGTLVPCTIEYSLPAKKKGKKK